MAPFTWGILASRATTKSSASQPASAATTTPRTRRAVATASSAVVLDWGQASGKSNRRMRLARQKARSDQSSKTKNYLQEQDPLGGGRCGMDQHWLGHDGSL